MAGAQAVYTDVWASMGQEDEAAERETAFAAYQVNEALFAQAAPDAVFMHCLPAHRGLEVTEDVIDSPRSIIYDQAENRLHVQKAILHTLLLNLRRIALPKKVVLAYSGGLDTSIIIPWLKETYGGCEVIAMIGDLGQHEDLAGRAQEGARHGRERRLHRRSARGIHHRLHLAHAARREPSTNTNICWALRLRARCSPSGRWRSRKKVGADALAHGCTGKGNDQVRFELAAKALAPELTIIAPWREWKINSREEAIAYAHSHNIPVDQTKKNIYSRDRNIWHLSHEGGVLEDPANAPEEAMWQWIVSPAKAPDQADNGRNRLRRRNARLGERQRSSRRSR